MDKERSWKQKMKKMIKLEQKMSKKLLLSMTEEFGAIKQLQLLKLLMKLFDAIALNIIPERYNEALLRETELTRNNNTDVLRKLKIEQIKISFTITTDG